jgi:hypothetical protein
LYQNSPDSEYKGVLVIWCGNLTLAGNFRGIVVNLYGSGIPGLSSCDNTKGTFKLADGNKKLTGWVYANGGTSGPTDDPNARPVPGIELGNDSKITALPGGGTLANVAFGTTTSSTPTDFSVQGWRELYQD